MHETMELHTDRPLPILARLEAAVFCFTLDVLRCSQVTEDGIFRTAIRKQFPGDTGKRTTLGALRVSYVASLAHNHILQVDRTLDALSEGLQVPRNDLNIVAAPKGIVTGNVAFVDEDGHAVDVSRFGVDGCLIPPRPERMQHVTTEACAIVVIEKEAVFNSLLHEPAARQLLETCIFVTGKGYPDFASRMFLARISEEQALKGTNLPIYVLTDADPHGISIAHCYIHGLPNCHVRWVGVRPSDNGTLFRTSASALLPITSTESALIDGMLTRMTKTHGDKNRAIAPLVAELNVLKTTGKKFEIEALAATNLDSNISGVLKYLLERTQHEFCDP